MSSRHKFFFARKNDEYSIKSRIYSSLSFAFAYYYVDENNATVMDIKVFSFLTREKKNDSSDRFSDGIIRSFIKV